MSPLGDPFDAEDPHRSWDRGALSYETAAGGTFGVKYDALGRITELPSQFSGGGKLETSYYVGDLTHTQTQGEITNTYALDATGRQRKRTRTKGEEESTEIYHYGGGSDSPAWIDKGEEGWTRSIPGIGGNLGAIYDSATDETVFQLSNMHGDVVATVSAQPTEEEFHSSGGGLLSTQSFDEYGNPKQNLEPDLKFGWLGSKQRRTELPSGVVQMGVRSYVPAMGRFLSVDPVPGGSANAYEYGAGDPVNNFDLTGEKCTGNKAQVARCRAWKNRAKKQRRARQRARSRQQKQRPSNATQKIVSSLKRIAGIAAPIAWGTRVPPSEVGPLKKIGAAFGGSSYIPKVHYDISSPAQFTAAKATGWAWCVVTNAWAANPVRGALGWLGMTAAFGGFCGGDRAWAYVHVT